MRRAHSAALDNFCFSLCKAVHEAQKRRSFVVAQHIGAEKPVKEEGVKGKRQKKRRRLAIGRGIELFKVRTVPVAHWRQELAVALRGGNKRYKRRAAIVYAALREAPIPLFVTCEQRVESV